MEDCGFHRSGFGRYNSSATVNGGMLRRQEQNVFVDRHIACGSHQWPSHRMLLLNAGGPQRKGYWAGRAGTAAAAAERSAKRLLSWRSLRWRQPARRKRLFRPMHPYLPCRGRKPLQSPQEAGDISLDMHRYYSKHQLPRLSHHGNEQSAPCIASEIQGPIRLYSAFRRACKCDWHVHAILALTLCICCTFCLPSQALPMQTCRDSPSGLCCTSICTGSAFA